MPEALERYAPYVGQALGLTSDEVLRAYRPAGEDDLPEILALRRRVNGEIWWDDERFVQWRYFSRRTADGQPAYWVFEKDGEVLAGCGIEPVTLAVDGERFSAVRTLDIMVRPDFDGLGLGALMNLVLFKHFPIAMVTGSNSRSHALLTRMFSHTTDLRFWKCPIRSEVLLDEKFRLGPASVLGAIAANPLLAWWRSRHSVVPPAGVTLREMTAFDSRAVDLSTRCESRGKLLVRRTDEWLNWRFVENPRCRHRLLGAFRGERLDGYIVTRFNRARHNPRCEAEIVDWLAAPETPADPSVLPGLVQTAVDRLVRDGVGLVSCAAVDTGIDQVMRTTGFRFRPGELLPFFVHAADASIHRRLSNGNDWYLTRGDHDVE